MNEPTESDSTFYVTTSIAYINAKPHIGYAMELIQADTLARYHRAQGEDTFFLTGTDEHGEKIARMAREASKEPQVFADEMSKHFRKLATDLKLSNDAFVRTTDPAHIAASQALWKLIAHDLYKSKYVGLYCVGCESYYQEKDLIDGNCPIHKKPLEKLEEENYFFKLSKYNEQLKQLIRDDVYKIVPTTRKNELLSVIESGLEDVSFSRPKDKLEWGIPVPSDANHVMYVWCDALTNYISALGFPNGENYKKFWPADIHVVGKDILRFHAAIWPAMLLSAGLPLPQSLYVHGFIDHDGHKMSKSLGNVIDPYDVIKKYGVDPMRYYLLRYIPSDNDGNFSWDHYETVYNTDLANDLGNLVQRTAVMIEKYLEGIVGAVPEFTHDVVAYHEAMTALRFDRALEEVWDLIRGMNQYIDEEKPWALAKTDPVHLREVLAHLVADLRQLGLLLLPFMPEVADKVIETFAEDEVHPKIGILFPKADDSIAHTTFHAN